MTARNPKGPHDSLAQRLYRFFAYYEPSQLEVLSQWLVNWAGHEQSLMGELVRFHGPEPPLTFHASPNELVVSNRQQLMHACEGLLKNFFLFYAPHRILEVDKTMQEWKGREEELKQRLTLQASQRDEVFRIFAERFPRRMSDLHPLLRTWLGAEADLILHLKANAPPAPRLPPVGLVLDKAPPTTFRSLLRDRLRLFYSVFQPEKLGDVDSILETYRGRENELLRSLRAKYLGSADDVGEPEFGQNADVVALIRQLAEKWMPHRSQEVEDAILVAESGTISEVLRALMSVPR
jgi:hypothetical protein